MDAQSLARLRRTLAALTDDALVAFANRGLVRRAAKDLEGAGDLAVEEAEHAVIVRGAGWTVTMPVDGPMSATDDTPATGVTRQIVTATMYLRDHWVAGEFGTKELPSVDNDAANEAIEAAAQRLIDSSPSDLFKWSGKTPLLEASAALGTVVEAAISLSPHLAVAFAEPGVQVVLLTDRPAKSLRRLLDQFKTTADKSEHARWVMLAVLALKQSAGKQTLIEDDPAADLTEAISDDRRRVSVRAQILLSSIAASGIAHLSTRIVERLRTAGVAAEAARFPRLARLLSSIADDAQLQIARNAAADPARMMQRMVVAHALSEAGSRSENAERIDLFGRSRTNYTPAGNLELCGLGAYGWRTASGFEGLTAIFWDTRGRRFLTASTSRSEGQDRMFSVSAAYQCGLGWSGGAAVDTMCRSRLTLSDAKTNVQGRLSLSETCRVALDEPTDTDSIDFGDCVIHTWSDLTTIAQRSQPLGLRQPDPRASFVVVRPKQWGQRWFDELDQAFVWQLHDDSDAPLEIRVPWTEVDESSVAFLESLKAERDHPTAILGRLEVGGGKLRIYPFAVFSSGTARGDKILCPQFDQARICSRNESLLRRLRKKFQRARVVETRIGDADADEIPDIATDDFANIPPLLCGLVVELDRVLSAALESGAHALSPAAAQTLSKCKDRLESLAIAPVANSLSRALETQGPEDVLRSAYYLHVFRQSLRLSRLH